MRPLRANCVAVTSGAIGEVDGHREAGDGRMGAGDWRILKHGRAGQVHYYLVAYEN